MEVINPKLRELERRQEELQTTVAYMRGELDEVKRLAGGTARQTIWQFVIFSVTMGAILLGGIRYQTETLRNEFNGKFEKIDIRFEEMEKRMAQMEKNLLARFEDLKQEVRSRR
ncbi:MAG: hypothetical protein IPM66_10905 [Acidobacteriota bacterium]|nr:MAG: hypothetical protein IPM66_10905 [Acidobacteriota bacterium]